MHMGLFRTYALGTFHNLCPWRTFRASSYTHFTTHTLVYYTHFSLRHTLDYTNNSLLHKIWFTTHTWVYDTLYYSKISLPHTLWFTRHTLLHCTHLLRTFRASSLAGVTSAAPSLISRCSVFVYYTFSLLHTLYYCDRCCSESDIALLCIWWFRV